MRFLRVLPGAFALCTFAIRALALFTWTATAADYQLKATPGTVAWGNYSAAAKPDSTVALRGKIKS